MYITYILHSEGNDKYYIGSTNNLERRLKEHNEKDIGYTSKYHPWELLYSETFPNRVQAMKSEKYLKSLKDKALIKKYIAGWRSSIPVQPELITYVYNLHFT